MDKFGEFDNYLHDVHTRSIKIEKLADEKNFTEAKHELDSMRTIHGMAIISFGDIIHNFDNINTDNTNKFYELSLAKGKLKHIQKLINRKEYYLVMKKNEADNVNNNIGANNMVNREFFGTNIGSNVRSNVSNNVPSTVNTNVRSNVPSANIGSNVSTNVRSNVPSAVSANVDESGILNNIPIPFKEIIMDVDEKLTGGANFIQSLFRGNKKLFDDKGCPNVKIVYLYNSNDRDGKLGKTFIDNLISDLKRKNINTDCDTLITSEINNLDDKILAKLKSNGVNETPVIIIKHPYGEKIIHRNEIINGYNRAVELHKELSTLLKKK